MQKLIIASVSVTFFFTAIVTWTVTNAYYSSNPVIKRVPVAVEQDDTGEIQMSPIEYEEWRFLDSIRNSQKHK